MGAKKMKKLPDAEFEIMKAVWASEQPITTSIVMQKIGNEKEWLIQWCYTKKVDTKNGRWYNGGGGVHDGKKRTIQRRIQAEHRKSVAERKSGGRNSERIWDRVVGILQEGEKVLGGSDQRDGEHDDG